MKKGVLGRLALGNRGDTIVEVMIVLAVLGLAIGISYATANRSLLNARQAQENSQAAELVQSQLEQLRTLTKSNCTASPIDNDHCIYSGSLYGAQNKPFCLVGGKVKGATPPSPCTNLGENGRYNVTITRDDTVISPDDKSDTFTVTAKWDDVLGEGVDTVTLSYRLPKPPILADDGSDDGGGDDGSGSIALSLWSSTPIYLSCSWPGSDHAWGGVNYSNWVYTVGSDRCPTGLTQCIPGVNCVSGVLSGYANTVCEANSIYLYGSTWNGHDNTATPCPPGTTRVSMIAKPLPGSPGPLMDRVADGFTRPDRTVGSSYAASA